MTCLYNIRRIHILEKFSWMMFNKPSEYIQQVQTGSPRTILMNWGHNLSAPKDEVTVYLHVVFSAPIRLRFFDGYDMMKK